MIWPSQVVLMVNSTALNGQETEGTVGSIPGLGRFPGGGYDNPLHLAHNYMTAQAFGHSFISPNCTN